MLHRAAAVSLVAEVPKAVEAEMAMGGVWAMGEDSVALAAGMEAWVETGCRIGSPYNQGTWSTSRHYQQDSHRTMTCKALAVLQVWAVEVTVIGEVARKEKPMNSAAWVVGRYL